MENEQSKIFTIAFTSIGLLLKSSNIRSMVVVASDTQYMARKKAPREAWLFEEEVGGKLFESD